jgi:succinate dehydrogenase/fumarate reductase cytochrome b subunit
MSTFLIIVLVGLMLAVVYALVTGIIAFLQTTEQDLKAGGDGGISRSAEKQNKAMFMRVGFQAAAIVVVMLVLLLSKQG